MYIHNNIPWFVILESLNLLTFSANYERWLFKSKTDHCIQKIRRSTTRNSKVMRVTLIPSFFYSQHRSKNHRTIKLWVIADLVLKWAVTLTGSPVCKNRVFVNWWIGKERHNGDSFFARLMNSIINIAGQKRTNHLFSSAFVAESVCSAKKIEPRPLSMNFKNGSPFQRSFISPSKEVYLGMVI